MTQQPNNAVPAAAPLWRAAGLLSVLMLLWLVAAAALAAPTFPKLTGRVVDDAHILPPETAAALTDKLAALEAATTTQLVVVTLPSLQGYEIDEYGYQLGRAWGIGQKGTNNGVLLIVAPAEHKVRIEVGYGLEPVLTDALTSQIIRSQIVPAFKAGNMPAGVVAGADALIAQLQLPPDQAKAQAAKASAAQNSGPHFSPIALFWLALIIIWLIIAIRRSSRGRRMGAGPVVIWGPGTGGWGGGGGGGWGGGGGFGGGGFGGGGGGFGGGGSSGGW